ncbi:MAG: histidine utilization repressor [Rhizomicrobium sp.]
MSDTTLHDRIRANIEARIRSGAWAPGHRIPYEHELMARYGCARMTVSKALASLAEAGLIVRRRRAGSFVAQPRVHSAVLDIPDIQADILARGDSYGLKLLSRRRYTARRTMPEEQMFDGAELLALRCLHLASGTPFALEQRLINLDAVPDAAAADFAIVPPGTWLLGHVAWTEAEHRITAINADGKVAGLLALAAGAACLALERKTWRGDQHITYVRQIFCGTGFDLVARFGPQLRPATA